MGKMQRNKGYRIEREIVIALNKEGIDAKRVPLSGAARGFKGDIVMQKKVCEVKGRANGAGFATIDRWLGGNDYLFLRKDRAKPLVVMGWDEFVSLIKQNP